MKKRAYDRKQIAVIVFLSAVMLMIAVFLNQMHRKKGTKESVSTQVSISAVEKIATPQPTVSPTPDPTKKIATYLQGPKSWKERRAWSGKWGREYYDGGKFGGFGCGLCCMANIYCSLTEYRCSPVDMYEYAKKESMYGGGGAIDWGFMKQTLMSLGFTCKVGRKPSDYATFQKLVKKSEACIVVVSSNNSTCYWENTPGHYVTLFLYNEKSDKVFLADSGDPNHNRHWVPLKKIYRSLKTANNRQYLSVTGYDKSKDKWKNRKITGNCILPEGWK